ncbi:kelch-like protein 24a [Branchiostoma lanceolatum]|uniref:kelch-like protein 24a n=1 Tax=Branchiostoma lanceolatum TaxID=7740 RepID=UPI003453F589
MEDFRARVPVHRMLRKWSNKSLQSQKSVTGDSQIEEIILECNESWVYPRLFMDQLMALRSEGHLVDVTLCAEGKEISCHRLVLSVCSDYFHAMFRGGHSESKKDKIEIGGVSAEALQLLVDYAYTAKVTITNIAIQPLFEAANMLQFRSVEDICEDFLTKHLSPKTCLVTWALADKVSCKGLLGKAKSHALKNFEDVCTTDDFLALPVDFLKTYISDDGLHAKKEELILEAIILWARHDLKERQSHLKVLLECVRFSLVDQDYLKNIMERDKELMLLAGVEELSKDQSTPGRPRQIHQEEILVLGGRTLSTQGDKFKRNRNMYRLGPHCDCTAITPLPEILQVSRKFAACVVNNDVIVTGGDIIESEFEAWRYKPSLNSWTELGSLVRGRYDHGMAVLQGQVYVVGGRYDDDDIVGLPDVELYNEGNNSWNEVAPLQQGVCEFGITTSGDKIYVFGGRISHTEKTAFCQCYDPTSDLWTFVTPLPKSMFDIKACTVNSKIYLVGGQLAHVLCYDPQKDCLVEMTRPLTAWCKSGATVCGSEIYITGGCGERFRTTKDIIATVQCYNVSSNTMIMVKNLPLPLLGHITLTVQKPQSCK